MRPSSLLLLGATCLFACGPASEAYTSPATPSDPGWPPPAAQSESAGAPSAAPTSAPTAAGSDAPAAAPPPPPVEVIPEKLGTPASSFAAAPTFWRRERGEYAPYYQSPRTIFDAVSAEGAVGVALACRLSIGRFSEEKLSSSFRKADLMVTTTLGKGKDRVAFLALGPEDTNEMDFLLPLLPLVEGESVAMNLVDRDVFSHDQLARFTITRRGAAPLTFRAAGGRGECRSVPRAVLEASFERARDSADKELAKMASERPDIAAASSFGIGRLKDGLGGMTQELEQLAALVGWDDPRVVRRVERAFALRASQVAEVARQAEQRRAALPSPTEGATPMADGAIEVRAKASECGPDVVKTYRARLASRGDAERLAAGGCVVRLEVRSRTAAPLVLEGISEAIGPLESLGLISKTGFWFNLRTVGEVKKGAFVKLPPRGRRLRFGETVELVALPYREGSNEKPEPPFLLRGRHDKRTSSSAVEWTSMAGGALQVRATRIACDQAAATEHAALIVGDSFKRPLKASGCVARIEVKNTSGAPTTVNPSFGIHELHHFRLIAPSRDAVRLDVIGKVDNGAALPLDGKLSIAPSEQVEIVVATSEGGFPAALKLDACQLLGEFGSLMSFARVE